MNTAEIVVREVQRNSGFQVRQLFAERIGKPRQSPHLHSHCEVLPFHVAGRDMVRVGPSVDYLGYNLRDPWWGVPRVGAIVLSVIAEQFHKLREVSLPCEDTLDRTVKVIAVRGDLEPIFRQALLESSQEFDGGFLRALADLEVRHQLGIGIERNKYPLVAELRRISLAYLALLLLAKRPDFIALQMLGTQTVHQGFHSVSGSLPCDDKQAHNGVAVEPSKPLCAANGTAFDKALNCTHCRVGIRGHRIPCQFVVGFAEGSFAGIAAPALDAALTKVSKSLAGLVFTSDTSHGVSPLAFCGETSQNTYGSEAWVNPRFGLAPQPVSAGSGALIVKGYPLGWDDGYFHRWTVSSEADCDDDFHCVPPFYRAVRSTLRGSYLRLKSLTVEIFVSLGLLVLCRFCPCSCGLPVDKTHSIRQLVDRITPHIKGAAAGASLRFDITLVSQAFQGSVNRSQRVRLVAADIESCLRQLIPDTGHREPFASVGREDQFNCVLKTVALRLHIFDGLLVCFLLIFAKECENRDNQLLHLRKLHFGLIALADHCGTALHKVLKHHPIVDRLLYIHNGG
jgi:hypothetical protein